MRHLLNYLSELNYLHGTLKERYKYEVINTFYKRKRLSYHLYFMIIINFEQWKYRNMRKSFYSSICFQIHLLLPKSNIRLYSVKMYTKTLPRVINQKWKKWKYIRKRLVSIKIEQIFYAFTSKWSISFIHYFSFCYKNFLLTKS